ncbi:MAG: 3-phosphoshikimate 1-carboxyvinyltransferase [Terriglobales bacterium]
MPDRTIQPARGLAGAMRPPGDKSISHRAAILAALGDGESRLANYASGADCQSTLGCLQALGVAVAREAEAVVIAGTGLGGLRAPTAPLDAGNSGSTLRMLSGVLAAQPFASSIGGDHSLSQRPMRRVVEPLARMGARIAAAAGDRPPLQFSPPDRPLEAIAYVPPVASAQVKTALLLAALYARGVTTVTEALPTRDHTEVLLQQLGAPIERRPSERQVALAGPVASLAPLGSFAIPGDPSSAAYFLCAAACFPGADLLVDGVSLNPTRSALLDVLARLGARPSVASIESLGGELAGSLHLDGPPQLGGATVAGAEAAALIDEIPILAVLATQTCDGIVFNDVAELRVKECDRLAAIAQNLRAMGAACDERPDGLAVPGRQRLHGATLATHGDHRIAMAFAVAALLAAGPSLIQDAACCAISYPDFFETLDRLAVR